MWFLTNYAKSCDLRSIMQNRNIAEYQKPCHRNYMTFASYQMHNTHVLCQHGKCWVTAATSNIHCKSGNLENVNSTLNLMLCELTYTRYVATVWNKILQDWKVTILTEIWTCLCPALRRYKPILFGSSVKDSQTQHKMHNYYMCLNVT